MLKQLESQVTQSLHREEICSVNYYFNNFPCFKPSEIIEVFVNIFRHDRNQCFDFICQVVIEDERQVRVKMERYSNILRGVLIENNNSFTTHNFRKEHIKQLKVLAIFPKQMLLVDVRKSLQMPTLTKTQEYVNQYVVVPNISAQNTALTKNKSKKQEKKEKVLEPIKSQSVVVQKKPLKKTQSKSSIQKMQIEQKPSIAPLKKVSSKDTPVNRPPVLTSYASQMAKVQEQQIEVKIPQSKKLNLDSDEQYFNVNPNIFNEQMGTIKQRNHETDHSGKKSEKEMQKMEIEAQHSKLKKDMKFVVDDDEDEDDYFVKQIAEQKKKYVQQENPSPTSTKSKQQDKVARAPLAPKPKVQAPKPAPIVAAKSKNAPLAPNKGALNLTSWLLPKRV